MQPKKFKITTTIISILLCFSTLAGNQDNSLSKALLLFDLGKYSEAEPILKELCEKNPDQLIVNYYYGACRTENGHYGMGEVVYLLNGSQGEAPLKTDYYLGIQYHAKDNWDKALKHYNAFKANTDTKMQNECKLDEKIQMCQNKINPFANKVVESEPTFIESAVARTGSNANNSQTQDTTTTSLPSYKTILASAKKIQTPASKKETGTNKEEETEEIKTDLSKTMNFKITNEITYLKISSFKTEKGLDYYKQLSTKQKELDKTVAEVEGLRKRYADADSYSEKQSLGGLILEEENSIYELQGETTSLRKKARDAETKYWETAPEAEKEKMIEETSKFIEKKQNEIQDAKTQKSTTSAAALLGDVLPTPQTKQNSQEGLVYKIQIGAYSNSIPASKKDLYKKLSYIRKIDNHTDENGVVVYTTGNLTNYNDALKLQEQVQQEGVKNASIAPYFNDKRISLEEAKKIEAEK